MRIFGSAKFVAHRASGSSVGAPQRARFRVIHIHRSRRAHASPTRTRHAPAVTRLRVRLVLNNAVAFRRTCASHTRLASRQSPRTRAIARPPARESSPSRDVSDRIHDVALARRARAFSHRRITHVSPWLLCPARRKEAERDRRGPGSGARAMVRV